MSTDDAASFVELLTGDVGTEVCWRTFPDDKALKKPGLAHNYAGSVAVLSSALQADNANKWGVFMVINGGGHDDASITDYRALFIDGDDVALPDADSRPGGPVGWHVEPDFLVIRDEKHWHAYWLLMPGCERADWLDAMRRLAIHYSTDPAICNSSRVMRVPGFLHCKAKPTMVTLREMAHATEYRRHIVELTIGLDPLPERVKAHRTGDPVTRAAVEEMLALVDPECNRTVWLSVAGALMNANVADDDTFDGLEVFTKWSAGEYQANV